MKGEAAREPRLPDHSRDQKHIVMCLHVFMICHRKSATGAAPQAVTPVSGNRYRKMSTEMSIYSEIALERVMITGRNILNQAYSPW